jgi:hypothetical protein
MVLICYPEGLMLSRGTRRPCPEGSLSLMPFVSPPVLLEHDIILNVRAFDEH